MTRKTIFTVSVITFVTICLLLPYILSPAQFLNHNNDLSNVFWPTYYFLRTKTLEFGQIAKWNNTIFSGTPIAPDPQFSLYYPINFIFLIFNTSTAFILHTVFHLLFGGICFYYFLKKSLKLSSKSSIFGAIIFIVNPQIASILEAGHYGLLAAYAWIPLVLIAARKKPSKKNSIILAFSLTAIFLNHTIMFLAAYLLAASISIYQKSFRYFILSSVFLLGLVAGAFLPQLEWYKISTRTLLLKNPELYPVWNSKGEIIKALLAPWIGGLTKIWRFDTEKIITIPIGIMFLSTVGFIKIKRSLKVIFILLLFIALLITANNLTPVYKIMLHFQFMQLARVTTRFWPIVFIGTIILAAYGSKYLNKKIVMFAVIIECFILSWTIINKPRISTIEPVPSEIVSIMKNDDSLFRVFCLNRCISAKYATLNNLQLIEGYNTFQQLNYFEHSWQLMGGYWNYYTLSLPPYGATDLNPNIYSLGEYNVKYIISPNELNNNLLHLIKVDNNYWLYENLANKPRVYYSTQSMNGPKMAFYSPNHIRVTISEDHPNSLVLSEVYNPNWKAYLNGGEKVKIQETPNRLRLIDLKEDTKFVDFKYESDYARIGLMITLLTMLASLIVLKRR